MEMRVTASRIESPHVGWLLRRAADEISRLRKAERVRSQEAKLRATDQLTFGAE
jgi:hypothetical protein